MENEMEFGLKMETLEKITHVFSSMKQVEQVILYGSRAIGNYREGSDIDISLKGSGLTSIDLDGFLLSLDELNLPYLFDISIYHHIDNEDLKDHIHKVGKILYSKQH